jgi:NADH:ubiquinone oxidoreductase subunit 5 (subunit L)/multisubunit Na+/H+ antiporter MnhA subunit
MSIALVMLAAASPVLGAIAGSRGGHGADRLVSGLGLGLAIVVLVEVVRNGTLALLDDWIVVDRVGAVWVVFALAIVLAVRQFARRQLAADPERERFHLASAVAAASGSLLFVAGHLVALAMAAVASSLALAWLVGARADARGATKRTRRVLLGADALLVLAVILAVNAADGMGFEGLTTLDGVEANVVAVLLVAAALVRCAQPPAQGWLVASLVAPTPASAILHAGLVNAGGVLLIRTAPVVSGSAVATAFGLAFAALGVVLGVSILRNRAEVKVALVWSTVAQMGFMLVQVLLGLTAAAAAHLVAHGAYKASLFLGSGSTLEHENLHQRQSRRTVDVVAAIVAGAVVTTLAVAVSGCDLSKHDGAATLIPLVALVSVVTILMGPAGLRAGAMMRGVKVTAALGVAATLYLTLLARFENWLGLPDTTPSGAGLATVVVVALVAASLAFTAWSDRSSVTTARRMQARLLHLSRRSSLTTLRG